MLNKYYENRKRRNKEAGFTLVELMVVVAVIGILISFAMPKFTSASEKAKATKSMADMHTIKNAAQLYIVEHDGLENKNISIESLIDAGYLDSKTVGADGKDNELTEKYNVKYEDGNVLVEEKVK